MRYPEQHGDAAGSEPALHRHALVLVEAVMVDLAGGRYISAISAVDISTFQKRFARGRANFVFSDEIASGAAREELEILFDEKIAVLALENAVTNALEHGTEGADIKIGTSFRGGKLKPFRISLLFFF